MEIETINKSLDMSSKDSSNFPRANDAFKRAKDILEEIDPEEISRKKIILERAKVSQARGHFHKALALAQKARNEDPLDHEVLTVLGEIFCDLKEFKLGLAELENALSYKPNDTHLLLKVGKSLSFCGHGLPEKGRGYQITNESQGIS